MFDVCSKIESGKLLVPKLDSLIKHLRVKKCIVARPRVIVSAYFSNPTNAHVKNEKLYASIGQDKIVTQVANARKVEWMKKYTQFFAIHHLFQQGKSIINFEAFKELF